ncbi:MAG TPA: hypothetical protein VHM89_00955 [Acidimicrobiales bacterium]|nr:hypothetical protein [Acidimicrobiales bacterium]
MRLVSRLMVAGILAILVPGAGVGRAEAARAIRPNQHFIGLVNGTRLHPVVYTVCPGPVADGRTGQVAGDQDLAVAHVASRGGFTGPFDQVHAWFQQDTSDTGPQQVTFTAYGVPQTIPAAVGVPCDGTGRVEFSSCPYLAPCAYGWTPTYVRVTFVNIAA